MLSLCIFILLISFAVSLPEWSDKSTAVKTFEGSTTITGIAVDSSNAYQYITLTDKGQNYLYSSNQGGVSASTSLTHIDSVWRFSDYNKIFYCSEKENFIFYSSTSSLELSSKNAAGSSEIPSDAYIRCYDYTKDSGKVLMMNFINSRMINKYELNSNNIYTASTARYLLKAFVKMPYTKSSSSDVYLYVLYDENEKVVYLMRTENSNNGNINFVGIKELETNIEIYDTVEISVIASKCKFESNQFTDYVMIFTYEKGATNFKYYYVFFYDQSKPKVLSYGDEMTFPYFNTMRIQKFKFIKDTTLFYYHITAEDNTSFIGTGDLLYNILIYNIKQDISSLSLDNTNRDSRYQNLLYAVNNTVYSVCPFVNMNINTNCDMLTESSSTKMLIDPNGNTQTSSCSLNSIGRYCVEECPRDYQSISNQCSQCGKYYNTTSKQCIDTCDKNYALNSNTKMCYNCTDVNKFYYNGKCIADCANIYAENIYGVCKVCKESQMWYQDKKCVQSCAKGYGADPTHNTCTFCRSINKFYLKGKCVDQCDLYQLADINNVCYYCNETTMKFYEDANCVSQCSEHYIIDDSAQICKSCSSLNLTYYIDNRTCVNECPRGYETKAKEKICDDCIGKGKLVYINKCVDSCPAMTYNDSDLFCKKCFCNGEHSTCINNENNTYTCQCMSGLTGTHCEVEHYVKKELNIYSLKDPVIRSQENEFSFHYANLRRLADSMLGREKNNIITWGLSYKDFDLNDVDVVDESGFINGVNETVFKIKKGVLKANCINIITLNFTDINSNVTYYDSLSIAIRTIEGELTLSLDVDVYIPMQTPITMRVIDSLPNRTDKLYYRFYYKDELGEKIAITSKLLSSSFTTTLPSATRIIADVSNEWNEVITIEKEISYNKSAEYTKTLNEILSIEDKYTKLQSLNYHFAVNGTFTAKEIDRVLSYAKEELSSEISNEAANRESVTEKGIIFKPNQYASLINKIALSMRKQNDIDSIAKISEIVAASTNAINSYSNAAISKSTLLSLYRNIDVINEISSDRAMMSNKKSIMNIRDYISRNMRPGEQIKIVGKSVRTFIDQPGSAQEHLYIKKSNATKKFDSFDDYEYDNQFKAENCTSETYFCISNSEYNKLYDEVTYLKKEEISKLTFSVVEIESNSPLVASNGEQIEKIGSSVFVDILSPSTNTSVTNLTTMNFEVKFDIKSSTRRLTELTNAEINKNTVCIPVNHIKNSQYYCYTYFNYKTNQMICRCNIADEITGVFDETLANAYKLLQFSPVEIGKVNYFSGSIILSSLGLIAIFSFLLLLYDIFDDRKIKQLDTMKRTERIKHEFSELKYLNNCNVISFAWYLTYFKYPFLNVFSFYNYDHPRYFRFFIQIFCLLLSMFFSAIPYYKSKFDRKIAFIDERNIEDEKINVHNFPCYFSEAFSGFVYSIIASIVVIFISAVFSKVLSFRKTRTSIWKPRKDILLRYVYDEIKSDVLLGDKWHCIKMRILAFNQLCGWKIIKRMKRNDKFSKYIDYKEGNFKFAMNFDKIELSKIENDLNEVPAAHKAPLIPCEEEKKTNNDSIYKGSDLEESDVMQIESPVKGFTLNKRVRYPLAVAAIQKFKRVKNKYILNHKIVDYRNEDDDESSIHISNDTRYEIVPNDNYTYISSKKISMKESNPDNWKILLNFAFNILLFALLIGLYYLILVVFHDIYTTYEGFIIKAWLIPALFQVTVFKFVLSYVLDLMIAIVLFRWRNKKRSSCLIKVMFSLCIERYMVYLNKIRLLITKYYKEFEFIQ